MSNFINDQNASYWSCDPEIKVSIEYLLKILNMELHWLPCVPYTRINLYFCIKHVEIYYDHNALYCNCDP